MKKVLGIVKTILVWVFVVLAISMTLFTIISVNTFNRNDRNILGYKAYIVNTDSMSKTDFKAGDLILVKETDPATLKKGDFFRTPKKRTLFCCACETAECTPLSYKMYFM